MFYSLHLSPPPPRLHDKGLASVWSEMWKGFSIVARNRKVLITSSTDAAKMIANGALMAFLPLYGVSVGLNPGEVGLLFTIQALTSFISKPIMGRVSDRMGRQPLIMLGLVICAATFVSIPHVSSWPCCSCSRRDLGSARRLSPRPLRRLSRIVQSSRRWELAWACKAPLETSDMRADLCLRVC